MIIIAKKFFSSPFLGKSGCYCQLKIWTTLANMAQGVLSDGYCLLDELPSDMQTLFLSMSII